MFALHEHAFDVRLQHTDETAVLIHSGHNGVESLADFIAHGHGGDALAHLALDTPTGKVTLDKNRQAVADNYLTEVAKADDGHLYNKVVKVIPAVNQTLGIPEADFMKLGVANRDNPSCP